MSNKKRYSRIFSSNSENLTKEISLKDVFKLKRNKNYLKKGNKVTDFTGWVYKSLVHEPDSYSIKEGLLLEEEISHDLDNSNYKNARI